MSNFNRPTVDMSMNEIERSVAALSERHKLGELTDRQELLYLVGQLAQGQKDLSSDNCRLIVMTARALIEHMNDESGGQLLAPDRTTKSKPTKKRKRFFSRL